MDIEEASPLILTNLHGFLRERDSVLASVRGERASVKEELTGGRALADVARLFRPGACVSGHVITTIEESVVIEMEGRIIGRAGKSKLYVVLLCSIILILYQKHYSIYMYW